jgi:hypothetical protein
VWQILVDKINLQYLVSEKNGQASLSRFQALVFTFVIGLSYFLLVLESFVKQASPACQLASQKVQELATTCTAEDCEKLITAMNDVCGLGLPDLPASVLTLLGISGGTYVLSKGIQKSGDQQNKNPAAAESGRFQR